ncbi:MAG: Endo-1,4-beta-xylanase A precursor [Planctomycetes bacterium ADurb.Bin401]|nr:MAG: Endo-1,4-beta-xylanase A precursor [Planctomycetes bacterium ADurb.Bin401]
MSAKNLYLACVVCIFTSFCYAENINVLINPGFEQAGGWSSRGGTFTQTSEQKRSGNSSGKSTGRTAEWQGIKQPIADRVIAGKAYGVSAWFKLENTDKCPLTISIEKHDDSGVSYTNITSGMVNNKEWTQLDGTFTVNASGTLTVLDIYFEGPPSGTNFFVDDVIVFGPPAEAAVPVEIKPQAAIKISPDIRRQKIDGFGAAGAWYDRTLAGFTDRPNFYTVLFKELGLDILRIRNTYDYNGNDSNYIERAVKFITVANQYSPKPLKLMITSWSPPYYLKSNKYTKGGTLAKDANGNYRYDDLAQWWVECLAAYEKHGIEFDYISMQNEPDYLTNWDTCLFDPNENANNAGYNKAFRAFYNKISKLPNPPKILAPEGKNISTTRRYIDALTPEDKSHIYSYAHHLYGDGSEEVPDSFVRPMARFAADYNDKPRMQTEFAKESDNGDVTSFHAAMSLAMFIHNSMAVENASAFLYWQIIWEAPLGLISTTPTTFTVNPVYYAMKHYCAYTDPGWQRVEASTDSPALRVSAYIDPNNEKISAVILNPSETAITTDLALDSFDIIDSNIYQSTESDKFISKGKLEQTARIALPEKSMTTVVMSVKKK